MGRLVVLLLAADLLWTWLGNVKDALLPPQNAVPADGLPITPDVAFGWLQVAVNGVMVGVLLWALWTLWQTFNANAQGQKQDFGVMRIAAYAVLMAFALPVWYAWFGTLGSLAQGRFTVSLNDWRYLVVVLCQTGLPFSLMVAVLRQRRLPATAEFETADNDSE